MSLFRRILTFLGSIVVTYIVEQYMNINAPHLAYTFFALWITWEALFFFSKHNPLKPFLRSCFRKKAGGIMSYFIVGILGALLAIGYWHAIQKILPAPEFLKLPLQIGSLDYDHAKITVLIPEQGFKGGNIWPDTSILNKETIAFYKATYVLSVKNNNKGMTIHGLYLHLLSTPTSDYTGKFVKLPIYGQKDTTINLNPGESALFEVAYHYSLTSPRNLSESLPITIPNPHFYGIYNPLHDPNNKYGFLDICRSDQKHSVGIKIDELPRISHLIQPIKLRLSATDFPPQDIVLKIIPDNQRGFKIDP